MVGEGTPSTPGQNLNVQRKMRLGRRAGPGGRGPPREGEGPGISRHFCAWLLSADVDVFLLNYLKIGILSFIIWKMICLSPQ